MKKIAISIIILVALAGFLFVADRISSRIDTDHQPIFLKRPPLFRKNQKMIDDDDDKLVIQEMRYQTIMEEIKKTFTPPQPGDQVEVECKDGTIIKGDLLSFDNIGNPKGHMQIMTPSGPSIFTKQTIADKSKIKCYTSDHIIYWTEKCMAEEFPDYVTPTNAWYPGGSSSCPVYPIKR